MHFLHDNFPAVNSVSCVSTYTYRSGNVCLLMSLVLLMMMLVQGKAFSPVNDLIGALVTKIIHNPMV